MSEADPDQTARAAWRADEFATASRTAMLPLAIWAAHFIGCYAAVAAGCNAGLDTIGFGTVPLLQIGLITVTLLVMIWLAAMSRTAWRRRAGIRCAFAALALVAVGWTLLPLASLPLCGR